MRRGTQAETPTDELRRARPELRARWLELEPERALRAANTVACCDHAADAARYRLLAQHARDLVLFISPESGAILDANRAAELRYGYSRAELRRLSIYDLRPDDRQSEVPALLEEALTRGVVFESAHRARDGTTFPVEVSSQSGTIDGSPVLVSIVRDISERAEQERFRDLFLGMLGHDLRNPLAAVVSGAHLLATDATLPPKRRTTVAHIQSSAARMARLIDQVLAFSRARFQNDVPLSRSEVDLTDVAERIIGEIAHAWPHADVAFEATGRTVGRWDSDRMEQVFSNLLGNAVAYGNGTVEFWMHGGGAELRIGVHNDGEPIEPALLAGIFEPFRRARARDAAPPHGLGIGLFITRAIVVAHGGTIEVRSTRAQGTTFEVALPY